MSAKVVAFAAVIAQAAAFAPTLSTFKPAARQASTGLSMAMDRSNTAPIVQIFDHRGCSRVAKEYTGKKCNGAEDEMLVKVQSKVIPAPEALAASVLQVTVGNLKRK
ncbi:phycoerythrin alpha subunit 4 [Guillardia theta CCMP2712]|uniref:Phycoerythrin alpha subunit 4 n=2 Tax=Guillardia theta TaxID=55529 RepID=L1IX61_GUITC|nr:phycoerythrin alpha subunit 4 [Guillardia theta CCMP2712]EKX40445.1 phycoerythrin alpha subunit 4 [Guillardia theta CCMP2712]CAM33418.1 phycoerythrin alpha subunit 4 precursor [Guillardia theta]|eukprot:XP_005827425.1 phycoerythrin alpha subunit 4 [Guillardia theta CCMP2712]